MSSGKDAKDRGTPGARGADSSDPTRGEPSGRESDRLDSSFRRLFADGLSGLLDSGGAIRRGHEAVSELASGTKDEVVRRVSSELRGFLDRLDVTDLAQQVLEGMTLEVTTQVRFRRSEEGQLAPKLEGQPDVKLRHEADEGEPERD
ncbi:MAG: hypothetical protein B7733_24590 [Myxococcales bacterium FL481]|nr:MAG: hypothetical protein B7733_24590 [Myxococcales bacterium FL481]